MKVRDLKELLSSTDKDMWGSVVGGSNEVKELYIAKGARCTIRIIGPTYKTSRCYLSHDNPIVSRMSPSDLRSLLKGDVQDSAMRRTNSPKHCREIEVASSKSKWSKCLLTTVVLLDGKKDLEKNIIYYLPITGTAIKNIIDQCSLKKDACISGVIANNIILAKDSRSSSFEAHMVNATVADKSSFLNREAINNILTNGLADAKEYYIELNKRNLLKKSGFFYSFASDEKKSLLDKYLEPIKQIKNYIEEDEQYRHISSDHKAVLELEGVSIVEFLDI